MNWARAADASKRTLSVKDDAERRLSDSAARWLERNDKAPSKSKEELRKEADRLVSSYAGPVTRLPAVSGNVSRYTEPKGKADRGAKHNKHRKGMTKSRSAANGLHNRAVPLGLVVYADGACDPNPGAGGWGFVVYNDCREVYYAHGGDLDTTNNRMELLGVIRALEWIGAQGFKPPIRLFCDSRYVCNGANVWRHGWKRNGWNKRGENSPKRAEGEIKNLDLWRDLDWLLTQIPIELEWCKGHAGIVGNERADELSLIGREGVLDARSPSLIEQQMTVRA